MPIALQQLEGLTCILRHLCFFQGIQAVLYLKIVHYMLNTDINKRQSIHPSIPHELKRHRPASRNMVRQRGSESHKHPPPTKLWFSRLCQRVSYDYNNCHSKNLFNMSRNMGMLPVFWIMLYNQVPVPGQHAQVSGKVKMS